MARKLYSRSKENFFRFFAGYYYNAFPNIGALIEFADSIRDVIDCLNILDWDESAIFLAIDSIVYGYGRIKHLIRENQQIKERVKQQVMVFQKYVSNANLASSEHQMIAGMLKTWDLGISEIGTR